MSNVVLTEFRLYLDYMMRPLHTEIFTICHLFDKIAISWKHISRQPDQKFAFIFKHISHIS